MPFSQAFENLKSAQSQRLFNLVREAILRSLGALRNRFKCRLVGFKKGSVIVETELIPIVENSESVQLSEINAVEQRIKQNSFASSFQQELASQRTADDDDFPEVFQDTISVEGVVDTETEGRFLSVYQVDAVLAQ